MFERNRVDHHEQFKTIARPVRVILKDGSELRGRMVTRQTHKLATELNQDGQFVEFEPYGGDMRALSKSSIREVIETNVPENQQLSNKDKQTARFDPLKILGLPRGATPEAIRTKYVALAKTYHPDRFAALDMPDEIVEYVCAMASRVNAAYTELMPEAAAEIKAQEQAAQQREEIRQQPAPGYAVPRTRHPQAL